MSAQTLTIELKDPKALQLLESLEVLKVIHIISKDGISENRIGQEPMSVAEFVEDIRKSESEIDNGDFDTLNDFERSSRSWD